MRVAIYARVSTESQEARGTIGSQLEVLRQRAAAEGHELVAEYRDEGWSGARLDRFSNSVTIAHPRSRCTRRSRPIASSGSVNATTRLGRPNFEGRPRRLAPDWDN